MKEPIRSCSGASSGHHRLELDRRGGGGTMSLLGGGLAARRCFASQDLVLHPLLSLPSPSFLELASSR